MTEVTAYEKGEQRKEERVTDRSAAGGKRTAERETWMEGGRDRQLVLKC